MKKSSLYFAVVLSLLLINGQLLMAQSLGGWVRGLVSAIGGAFVEKACEKHGYSREEAKQNAILVVESLGGSSANAEKGIRYVTESDKHIKQEIVASEVFDGTGVLTGQSQLMNTFKSIYSAQMNYRSEVSKATTDEERRVAFDKRSQNFADVMFDTYEAAQERKAQHLATKTTLAKSLRDQGYSPEQAVEIAGSMLAIERAKYMTDKEKQEYINAFLPNESAENVLATIKAVDLGNALEEQIVKGPTPEDIAAQKEAEQRERERIEKEKAVSFVNQTVVDLYQFDVTNLSQEQMDELDKISEILIKYSDLNLEIKGHTCNIGYKSVNEHVGLRRAETAKAYLVDKGIAADRISTVSGGENEPVVDNSSSEKRKQNRRLTFEIR